MEKETKNTWLFGWCPVVLLAVISVVSLSLFYFPSQPQDLVSMTEPSNRCEWTGKREVFPLSGLLLGMCYSCMDVKIVGGVGMPPVEVYSDFQMPDFYYCDSVRVWIRQGDYDRLLKANDKRSDERLSVKTYRIDVLDRYDGWQRYVAQHPHGSGGWFAFGAMAGILCIVLLIKKVFYS